MMATPRSARSFLQDPRGFSGAEKALLITFALAVVILVGALLRGGSQQAAADAQSTLARGMNQAAKMGQLMQPGNIAAAQAPQQAGASGTAQASGALRAFSSDFRAPPTPPRPAAPQPPAYRGPAAPATIGNFRELARFVFDRYDTDHPIGIVKLEGMGKPTYMVVLSGTELNNPGQATFLPEDVTSSLRIDDRYRNNILFAMQRYGIPQGADIIVAGHSLGGMEAQNLIADKRFKNDYNPIAVVTYGSPITTPNQPGIQYARYATWGDPITRASPLSAAWTVSRTAAWGGHYLLKWGSLGRVNRVPIYEQAMIGPQRTTPSLAAHSYYPTAPELERSPLNGPDGKPLRLDTGSFRTFENPSNLRPLFNRKVP